MTCGIDLNTSTFPTVIDLIPFVNEITVAQCSSLQGRVLITGTLRQEVLVKMQGGTGANCASVTCGGQTAPVSCGPVQYLGLSIALSCDIHVPDAQLGDCCKIQQAKVIAQNWELVVDPFTGFVIGAREETCMLFEILLLRMVRILVPAKELLPAPCRPPVAHCSQDGGMPGGRATV